jgi:hypothetical protein
MDPGDSLLFAAKLQHRWRNAHKGVTQVLIVLSSLGIDERPSEYHIAKAVETPEDH